MEDVRIVFNGAAGTHIDLTRRVSGKTLYMQKACVNVATENGTDPLYEDRGTDILSSALNGLILDDITATHYGNFAALDTLNFINFQEYAAVQESPDLITDINITLQSLSVDSATVNYSLAFRFADDTASTTINSITFK